MRAILSTLLLAICLGLPPAPVAAEGEKAGAFDYYVLSLSWQPNWCAIEVDARDAPECGAAEDFGWILHGLWPQYERGWPSYCPTFRWRPSRAMAEGMRDIMGSSRLARHQWNKHGVCSGLSAEDYFRLSRQAYEMIERPAVFRDLTEPVRLPARVVEEAFLEANPGLEADMITITCKAGRIQEARICLTRDLEPMPCGWEISGDCTRLDALFDPVR